MLATHPFSLDVIQVASPCQASWDAMTGDEQTRFCSQCSKYVYNLTDMSRDEAERLVSDTEGSVCVRFYRRSDGTVLTADCPVGLWDVRTRLMRLWAGVAAMIGFLTFGAISWGSRASESSSGAAASGSASNGPVETLEHSLHQPELIMGKVCPPSMPVNPAPPVQQLHATDLDAAGDPEGN